MRLHPVAGIGALAGGGILREIALAPRSRPTEASGSPLDSRQQQQEPCYSESQESYACGAEDAQSEHESAEYNVVDNGVTGHGTHHVEDSLPEDQQKTSKFDATLYQRRLMILAEDQQKTSKFGKGEVVQLVGQSGWVRPDIDFAMTIGFEIEQKLIRMNKDLRKKSNKPFGEDNVIFFRVSDVAQKGLVLKVGSMIQFKLYTFEEGVGACEIKKACVVESTFTRKSEGTDATVEESADDKELDAYVFVN